MKINKLVLKNFRNHVDRTIDFTDGVNLIIGSNGAGKTNILEAIHLISTTKSIKAKHDRDLINYGSNFCTVNLASPEDVFELQVVKSDEDNNTSSKKAKINKTPKSLNYFAGKFNSVMFTPQDVEILTGSPSIRRRYIDMVLTQTNTNYKKSLNLYIKAVRQRNKVLEMIKENRYGFGQLDYWNEQVLNLGSYLQKARIDFFGLIENLVQEYNLILNGNQSTLKVLYDMSEMSTERLEKYKDAEIAAKSTLVGPHRDDFEIQYNDKNIAYFGSRGQQRTAMLAIKLAEIDFIKQKTGENPILLLDDIFSELDSKHRNTVNNVIKNQQTIITSTEKPEFTTNNQIAL